MTQEEKIGDLQNKIANLASQLAFFVYEKHAELGGGAEHAMEAAIKTFNEGVIDCTDAQIKLYKTDLEGRIANIHNR